MVSDNNGDLVQVADVGWSTESIWLPMKLKRGKKVMNASDLIQTLVEKGNKIGKEAQVELLENYWVRIGWYASFLKDRGFSEKEIVEVIGALTRKATKIEEGIEVKRLSIQEIDTILQDVCSDPYNSCEGYGNSVISKLRR